MDQKKDIIDQLNEALSSTENFDLIISNIKAIKNQYVAVSKEEIDRLKKEFEESGSEEEFKIPHDEWDGKFADLLTTFNQRKKKYDDERASELNENLKKKKKILEDLDTLIAEEHHIGAAFDKFNELKEKWKTIGDVPANNFKDIRREYSNQIERFFYNINIYKSLKDYDLKKNLRLKKDLIEKVKKLEQSSVNEMRELINIYTHEWDEIGPTVQSEWEKVRDEFWENVRVIHKKIADYYKGQKEKIKDNLTAKEALCEKLEELGKKDLSDIKVYNKAHKEVNQIKDDWKKLGFAGKKTNDEVWQRFRIAMDAFYKHKKEEQEGLKETFKENEEKKHKLIEKAEELKDSMDWRNTAELFKRLQTDWKRIGSAHPSKEQKLWKKFRNASEHFFAKRKDYFDNQEEREKNNLNLKKEILAKLSILDVKKGENNLEVIQDLVKQFNVIGYVPKEEKGKIENDFNKIRNQKMKEVGLDAGQIDEQSFELKIEGFKVAGNSDELLRNEYRHLDEKLRRIEADIKQYENNLGFFGGNTNSPLVKEVVQKIENSKQEADKLRSKIKMIAK